MDEIDEERRRRGEVEEEDESELLGQLHTPVTKQSSCRRKKSVGQ